MSKIQVNGIVREMTAEEQAIRDESEVKCAEIKKEAQKAIQAKIDLKASAKAKLVAGEKLTEEEANLLVGV